LFIDINKHFVNNNIKFYELNSELIVYDKNKIKWIEDRGYEVLIIWDSEYHKYPELVLKQCIEFIKKIKNYDIRVYRW
jgi:very-short-patch-repair endonuclease